MAHLKHWYSGTHLIVVILSIASVIIAQIINYQGDGSCRLCSNWVNITTNNDYISTGNSSGNGTVDITCSNTSGSIDLGYFMSVYNALLMGIQVLFFMIAFTYFTGKDLNGFGEHAFLKHIRLTLSTFHIFHTIVLVVASTFIISLNIGIKERTACSKVILYWYYAYFVVNLLHSGGVIGKMLRDHLKNGKQKHFNVEVSPSATNHDIECNGSYPYGSYGTGSNTGSNIVSNASLNFK